MKTRRSPSPGGDHEYLYAPVARRQHRDRLDRHPGRRAGAGGPAATTDPIRGADHARAGEEGAGGRRGRGDEEQVERRHRRSRSEEHTSELQSLAYLVCRLLLEKKKKHDRIAAMTLDK